MDLTITLSVEDIVGLTRSMSPARGIARYPETLFDEATEAYIETVADERTLNYGTCLWYENQLDALLATKVLTAAGHAACLTNNFDRDPHVEDPIIGHLPQYAVVTSYDVNELLRVEAPDGSWLGTTDVADQIEQWLDNQSEPNK